MSGRPHQRLGFVRRLGSQCRAPRVFGRPRRRFRFVRRRRGRYGFNRRLYAGSRHDRLFGGRSRGCGPPEE